MEVSLSPAKTVMSVKRLESGTRHSVWAQNPRMPVKNLTSSSRTEHSKHNTIH